MKRLKILIFILVAIVFIISTYLFLKEKDTTGNSNKKIGDLNYYPLEYV